MLLSFEDGTVTKLSYSGFYRTLDLEQNAELRILLRCSPTSRLGSVEIFGDSLTFNGLADGSKCERFETSIRALSDPVLTIVNLSA
jgi:hypothetical protein